MTKGKKSLRVLLLSPPYPHLGGEELFGLSGREEWFPLGAFSIANAISMEEIADARIYFHPDYTPARLESVIREYAPDVVGITCYTNTRFACFEMSEIVKRISKDIKVLLGGPHATFLDQQIIKNYPCVDMIVRGYAEGAFLDVIRSILNKGNFETIEGLTWRDTKNKFHRNCDRPLDNDLTRELFPDIKNLFIDRLPTWKGEDMILSSLPIETSRGCVYACIFCSRFDPGSRKTVEREPAQVLRYVQELFEVFGRSQVFFCDTNFTINKKRVYEFCSLLQSLPFELEWTCGTRVDLVDREMLCEMKRAGCKKIYYGVDSLCKRILPSIGRFFKPEVAVEKLNLTVECGLETEANLIIGFPGENVQSVTETYSYLKQLDSNINLVIRPLNIMPGGSLYYQAVKEGFEEDYWLEDHGSDFPIYTFAMSEERIIKYCCILKDSGKYVVWKKKNNDYEAKRV